MKDLIDKHRDAVTKLGYSKDQAEDVIHRVSAIMNAFIDAAWGVHPAQLGSKTEGKKVLLPKAQCDKLRTKQKQRGEEETAAPLTEG